MKRAPLAVFAAAALLAPLMATAQFTVRPWTQDNAPLDERVAADFREIRHPAAFVHYAVPAMSPLQRLPDVYPEDGIPGGVVRIVAARDEYEPGSFLIRATRDLGKTQLSLTPFKNADGRLFPAEDLDLKFVKVWYQNRNAWYSYFGDTGFKLVPELLVNDEDLIRVDTAKQANYARLKFADGKTDEIWINPPRAMNNVFWDFYRSVPAFQPMRPEFRDAPTLQPVKSGTSSSPPASAPARPPASTRARSGWEHTARFPSRSASWTSRCPGPSATSTTRWTSTSAPTPTTASP